MTDRRPTLVEVGVPMRLGSISGGRFDLAPEAVRVAVDRFVAHRPDGSSRLEELELNLERHEDIGAAASMRPGDAFGTIRDALRSSLEDRTALLLGGDNSITRPGVHALVSRPGAAFDAVGLLTIDAHHDLRPLDGGLTNGNPVRALLEDGLPGRNVVQVGIQPLANPAASAGVASGAGITVITAEEARVRGVGRVVEEALDDLAARVDAIYVDLDVDVLDRAFAPACPGARPGG
ncbi:MAG TPA: arginase family protein, partial [Actinomycetota bacterium]|nr:arginase family protein [Actinomycetota bacterium]